MYRRLPFVYRHYILQTNKRAITFTVVAPESFAFAEETSVEPEAEQVTVRQSVVKKAFKKTDGENAYAEFDQTGFKASFKKNTVKPVSGDYKSGSVYGPRLNAKQLSQVKSAVQKFCDRYITSDMSDVEKVMAAQLFMARTCIYAPDWSKNGANTAWGALVYKDSDGYHEAQCSGFARGMKALCNAASGFLAIFLQWQNLYKPDRYDMGQRLISGCLRKGLFP